MLTIEVFSFSYKKGYPEDISGNGGGFIFDCRFLLNPGRFAEYKHLTGRDRPVIEFLENKSEIGTFLANVAGILRPAVTNYLERNFDHLLVGFGCTGGQHRSVYSAHKTAEWLAAEFPEAEVLLQHLEQPRLLPQGKIIL